MLDEFKLKLKDVPKKNILITGNDAYRLKKDDTVCPICYEDHFEIHDINYCSSCKKILHNECITPHLNSCLRGKKIPYCSFCKSQYSISDQSWQTFGKVKDEIDKITEMIIRKKYEQTFNTIPCRGLHCEYLLSDSNKTGSVYKCPYCLDEYCNQCETNHEGLSCSQYLKQKKEHESSNSHFKRMLHDPSSDLRPCPYCHTPFMKDDKCNYITCKNPKCNKKWDWIKGKWKYGNDHNRRTDGFYENWKKGDRMYRIPGDIKDIKTGEKYKEYIEL